jgi:hypothetical protein
MLLIALPLVMTLSLGPLMAVALCA